MTSPTIGVPGQVIDLVPECRASGTFACVKTRNVELVQLIVAAGKTIPCHEAQGETILHCLHGHVFVNALGAEREIKAGQLVFLAENEPFSMRGIVDSSLLVTMLVAKKDGQSVELIGD